MLGKRFIQRARDHGRLVAPLALIAVATLFASTLHAQTITPIADIQANPAQFQGTVVTVEGQVYIPANYISSRFSGYIQDASGRGLNLFGSTANDAALFDVSNIVRVTGTVELFFTTVEITGITEIVLLSSGNPPLSPMVLGTGAAASAAWEGTFIQTTGEIQSVATTGGSAPATNYTINDGSGPLIVRVVEDLGAPSFSVGQSITGRGAGAAFGADFQILVGRASDVFLGGGEDTTPPTLVSASATSPTQVNVQFSEALDSVSGGLASNYEVFETAVPGNTVGVSSASVVASVATLNLASSLQNGVNYTVRVQAVEDLAGNVIVGTPSTTFTPSASPVTPIADIQANPQSFEGQVVTVEGQVYIPTNYIASRFSGYIQDSSNRGINLFGDGANDAALFDRSNVVRVTGTVALFFTTVEIENITNVTLVSSGNPPLQPTVLSTGAAGSSTWEGTFIESSGEILAIATTGGSAPATNYTINDGSGPLIIRVVDDVGAQSFSVGQTITARGAGSAFQSDFQILVGRAEDVFQSGGGPDVTPPQAVGATAASATQVNVSYSEAVTPATAQVATNYAVFETATPGNTIAITSVSLSTNGRTATLNLGASLGDGVNYTVRINNVQDLAGNTIASNSTVSFLFSESGVTPIAVIQADPDAYNGQTVTVQGQVYVPANYRGTVTSGYIQDESGRGINIFGSGANTPIMNDITNIVRITGEIEIYFTTTEITNISEVTLISSDNPPLLPTPLSTGAAASSDWEGTFIQVTGEIRAKEVGGPGLNYTVNDDSGPIVIRVVDTVGADELNVGQIVTARGAGGQFGDDFQINVGRAEDFFEGEPSEDILPPALLKAILTATTEVTLQFNEEVETTSSNDAANYEVFRTNAPGTTVEVAAARYGENSRIIVLELAAAINVSDRFTVRVRNVQDLAGNAISAAGISREIEAASIEEVTLRGPAFTFLPRQGERYPITFTVPSRVATGQGEILLRVFDLNGRLRKTLFDSRFEDLARAFENNRAERTWDGRDNFAELVSAGTYIVHLLVVDSQSGERKESQMPVVVATRLDR